MYVSAPNRVFALDSHSGREIWAFTYRKGPLALGRWPAPSLLPTRRRSYGEPRRRHSWRSIFLTSSNAHLLCINRLTGGLMWESHGCPRRDCHRPRAPLVVGDLVISGMSGGDGPLLGFLAAFRASTGQEVWRFHPIPKPGEPAAKTWQGPGITMGGGATWLTGSYDVKRTSFIGRLAIPTLPLMAGPERRQSLHELRRGPESCTGKLAGTTSSLRTTCTIGMQPSRSCWWTRNSGEPAKAHSAR